MQPQKVPYVTMGANLILTAVKGTVGLLAGSTALLADAAESTADIVVSMVVMGGMRVASRPPDESHPYGHEKAESVAAKAVAILVVIAGLGIGWMALRNLLGSPEPPGAIAAWVAALTILVKELLYRFLRRESQDHDSPALAADASMQRSDAFSSVATLLGIIGARLGYPILDPVAGVLVAALILRLGISIYIQSINELMDTAPDKAAIDEMLRTAEAVSGVECIDDLKARLFGGKGAMVDIKIAVRGDLTVEEGHRISKAVKKALLQLPAVRDVLVHVNPVGHHRK